MLDSKRRDELMRAAIRVAGGNPSAPFGSVIADAGTGEILAEGLNDARRDPTLHGETAALRSWAANDPGWRERPTVLVTTAEPCPMCAGAIAFAGIRTVYYGVSIPTLAAMGWDQIDLRAAEVARRAGPLEFEVCGGVLEGACRALFAAAARHR